MSEALVTATVLKDRGHINLRGKSSDAAFVAAIRTACAVTLPGALKSVSQGDLSIYWLGPDEWSLQASAEQVPDLLTALNQATAGLHVAINDLSATYVTLRLSGSRVHELLAKGCSIDLHPLAFASGACTQTGLAKAGILLARHDAGFTLLVRRSFAAYLLQWLQKAGAEYGIEFA